MTGTQALEARAALGGAAAVCTAALGCTHGYERLGQQLGQRRFDLLATLALLASRLGLYWFIFFGLRIPPRGDIPVFYRPEALAALAGKLPYRDFGSSYAPLHPFLGAAVLRLWNSPLAFAMFAILVEAAAFPIFLAVARCGFREREVRLGALLYLASPISLQFVAVDGQDNVLVALLLTAAMLFLFRDRNYLSGASLALAVVSVKFLPLLFAPVLLLVCRKRARWMAGFGGVLGLGYLPFAVLRLPLLYPLRAEGQARTASDLPFLLEAALGGVVPGRAADLLLLLVLLGVALALGSALQGAEAGERMAIATYGCAGMILALLLLSKKSWPPYLMLVLFPVCMIVSAGGLSRGRVLAFAGFSWVAILAHSVWATEFLQITGPALHGYLAAGEARSYLFFLLQVVLVGGYGWLLASALRRVRVPLLHRWSNPEGDAARPTVCEVKYGTGTGHNEDTGTSVA